jgi:hypothetical protein
MIVWLLAFGAFASKLLEAEITATQHLISALKHKQAELAELEAKLTANQLAELVS